MIIGFTLLGYAAILATVGAWLLRRSRWTVRTPRLAITAWHALGLSVLSSALFGTAAIAARLHLESRKIDELLQVCVTTLREAFARPAGAVITVICLAAMMAVSVRTVWGLTITIRRATSQRCRQLQLLELIGRLDPDLDILVIAHQVPAAFCLSGRRRNVVVTTTALDLLGPDELAAVLAHERAHLRGRHHLLVTVSQGLARAFPRVPAFAWGYQEVRQLVELAADDQACRRHRGSCVARAMLLLAGAAPPATALAVGSEATHLRLQRLTEREASLRRPVHSSLAGLVAALLLSPFLVAVAPALIAAGMDYCGLS